MTHRFKSIGKHEYTASVDGQAQVVLLGGYDGLGPRGGRGSFGWQVIEYDWLEPDEWNDKGAWGSGDVIAEVRYFADAKRIGRERLDRAMESAAKRRAYLDGLIGRKCHVYDIRSGTSESVHEVMDLDETNGYAAIHPPIYFGETEYESVRIADLVPVAESAA